MDSRLDAQKNKTDSDQNAGKGTFGAAGITPYGQTLRNNVKPQDQTNPGPELLPNMAAFSQVSTIVSDEDGYEIMMEAEEAGTFFLKTSVRFNGDTQYTDSPWSEMPNDYVPF